MPVLYPNQSLPSEKQDEMISHASSLSGQIAAQYKNEQLVEKQIREELWRERLAEENAKKSREQDRKRKYLENLCGCEVYFLADYQTNLFDFGQIWPDKQEIDFVRYNLSLKRIELKDERRPVTDFSLSHKGSMFTLAVLKKETFCTSSLIFFWL